MTPNPTPKGNQRRDLVYLRANVDHGPSCGERVSCPSCGDPFGPHYRTAEQQDRVTGTYVLCNACKQSWRVVEAAA